MKSKNPHIIRLPQTMRIKPLIQLLGLALLPTGFVVAEENTQELETITVTASGYAQNIVSAPASISVVRATELNKKPYYSLMDAVRNVEGVGMSGGEKGDITIRGMPSSSTLILIDGRRQNSTRELNPKGGIAVEDNWTPPVNAINRIEVIRGPMSSLYGSDAMGGVINIITKKVNDRWTGSVGVQTTIQEDSDSGNRYQGNVYVSGPLLTDKLGLQLWGQKSYREEDKIVGGFDKANSISGNARLWFTPTEQQDFMFEVNSQKQKYDASRYKTVAEKDGKGKLNHALTKRNYTKQSYTFAHNGRWELGDSKFSYIFDKAKRATYSDGKEDVWMPEIKNHTIDGSFIAPIGLSNTFTIGGQWRQNILDIDGMRNANLPYTIDKKDGKPIADTGLLNAKVKQWAIFVENTWELTDGLALTGGLRFDDNQIFGSHISPRAYANWTFADHWTLKGGIASGFVPPSMKEYVPYIGNGQRGGATTWGNPNLKPETSLNREIGLYYDNTDNFSANITYFNTNYKNKIANTGSACLNGPDGSPSVDVDKNKKNCWAGPDNRPMSLYFNVPKATIQGVELASHWKINSSFKLNGHYTFTDSKMKTAKVNIYGFDLSRADGLAPVATPKHMANAQLDWMIKDTMSTYLSVNYRGKDNRGVNWGGGSAPMNESVGSLTTFDLGYSWNINKNISLNAGIKNIFNQSNYDPQVSGVYQYIEDGRRYWLSVEGKI